MAPLSSIEPPKEAADCVAYLNEAWTPYHAVLASCKRLVQAGFKVRTRVLTDLARSNKRAPRRRPRPLYRCLRRRAAPRRDRRDVFLRDAERRLAHPPQRVDRTARS